jgi:Ribbon-helix-helix protein, copG family
MRKETVSNTSAVRAKPRKQNVAIYLEVELVEAADEYCRVTGTSRSWVFRNALKRLLEDLPRPAREAAPVTKLRGEPEGTWSGMD